MGHYGIIINNKTKEYVADCDDLLKLPMGERESSALFIDWLEGQYWGLTETEMETHLKYSDEFDEMQFPDLLAGLTDITKTVLQAYYARNETLKENQLMPIDDDSLVQMPSDPNVHKEDLPMPITYTCTECYNTTNIPGKCPNCGADTITNAVYDIHGLPKENTNTMHITIMSDIETYQYFAGEKDSYGIVPFTGMVSEYLLAAVNAGIAAPFYNAQTDIESLFYASMESRDWRTDFWLRDNGGIDAWIGWDDILGPIVRCQINPAFAPWDYDGLGS